MGWVFYDFFGATQDTDESFKLGRYLKSYGPDKDRAASDAHDVIARKLEKAIINGKKLTIDINHSSDESAFLLGKVFDNLQGTTGRSTKETLDHLNLITTGHKPDVTLRRINKIICESDTAIITGPPAPKP